MNNVTQTIQINAKPSYLSDQSDPSSQKFLWSYEITIVNNGEEIVQLLSRKWRVTDMSGRVEDIEGVGVIGLQPVIKPQQKFTYSSFCQLYVPQGTMEGYYEFKNIMNEKTFRVEIPKFILSAPTSITKIYQSKLH